MAKQKLEFVTRLAREDVAGLIEALVEGLKDGVLKVKKSGDSLALEVPRVVDLEVGATINDERAEFAINVSWRTNRAENPDTAPPKVASIGSGGSAGKGKDSGPDNGQGDERAREALAVAAHQLDVSAKKAAGTMKKVTRKKKT